MGFMSMTANDGDRINAMGADNPVTELTADGLFSGTVGAVGKGVAGGVAAVGRMAYDAFNAANKANIQGDNPEFGGTGGIGQGMLNVDAPKIQASDLSPQMDEALKATREWAKIDPRTAGVGAQTLGSLAHGATVFGLGTLAGGPMAGMATMGATEGYNDYRDSVAAGVDPTTAMEKATATGLFAAAGAALPFKFGAAGIKGLVASVAGGASVNTGFGVANRFLSSEILSANGYKDMAQQYRPLDQQSMLADAILGAAFGGFAHLTHGAEAPAAARPTDDMVEQAMDARRQDAVTRAGPGIPIDPEHSTLDGDLQDRALGNLLRGKPADITSDEASAIVEHTIADPERVQLHNDYQDANLEVHGQIADFSEPAQQEGPVSLSDFLEKAHDTNSLDPALEGYSIHGSTPEVRAYAKQLQDLNLNAGFEFKNQYEASAKGVEGEYWYNGYRPGETHSVALFPAGHAERERVILHEATHAAVYDKINKYADMKNPQSPEEVRGVAAVAKLEAIRQEALKVAGPDDHYGLTDLHEFASELKTRPEFQEFLKSKELNGKSLWEHTKSAVKSMLGIKGEGTYFDKAMEATDSLIGKKTPVVKPEAPEGAASVPVTGAAQISPIHQEMMNQIALRHPDMDVEGPNGQTIKARDLPQALADHAAQAASESKLHDVAMACFMRTM